MNKLLLFAFIASVTLVQAQTTELEKDTFQFTIVKQNKITPVKNQASSGTCWSFSGLGLYEAELLRLGKPETDLAEMFIVSHSYSDKAKRFVRLYGETNFTAGGSFYDVTYVLKNYGIVPESEMRGLNYGEERHKHAELDALLSAYVKVISQRPNKTISTAWKAGFEGILDAYLGKRPTEFTVDGKKYTPQTYAQSLGLNFDDYISLTSFTHHPYYTKFAIEIPDNWRHDESYNLPLAEFMQVIDNAIDKGYCLGWASDVSERGFTRNGLAVNPETKKENLVGSDQARWLNIPQRELEDSIFSKLNSPQPEMLVTQELRQQAFDNQSTTDDHGMLIFGTAKDQNGIQYYLVKNSWGTDNKYQGIWYASRSFVEYKTVDILVHKDAIPKEIRNKLGIK
ncbi:MAG: aminopeptidase [Dysgonamonadaceae bacterium]|jgi:aminopeptidase C|nr:aminopeptidase [Dysgonamonadaceae bacterium]